LLARRLVEKGVTFVTVNSGGWDHHAKIWEGREKKLLDFDQGFSALINDMHDRGLLEDTLVLAMGEFGRSPKVVAVNDDAHDTKGTKDSKITSVLPAGKYFISLQDAHDRGGPAHPYRLTLTVGDTIQR